VWGPPAKDIHDEACSAWLQGAHRGDRGRANARAERLLMRLGADAGTGYVLQSSAAMARRTRRGARGRLARLPDKSSCLTPGQHNGVRFTGAAVSTESGGAAKVLWVDCSGR